MRKYPSFALSSRCRIFSAATLLSVLALPAAARADGAPVEEDEASFGTTPARSPSEMVAPAPKQPSSVGGSDAAPAQLAAVDPGPERGGGVLVATSPPKDWYVLHAGLRPRLGTFAGIATLELAHARTERFYGLFSFSAVRNDAGTHIGVAQIAFGRNLADTFGGVTQLSLTENRARHFVGLGQVGLAYNRTLTTVAVSQVGAYNRARSFVGVAQIGAYDRTDESFTGLAQVGAFEHARGDFTGLVQLGVASASGPDLSPDPIATEEHEVKSRFLGLAQIGVYTSASGHWNGLLQAGVGSTATDFAGGFQVSSITSSARTFRGIAEIAPFNMTRTSYGMQIGGGSLALDEHTGLQLDAALSYAKRINGAQVGVANLAEEVHGVQIGLFNHTERLRGVQIGLANHASDGVLPWTAILNMGFGDDLDSDEDFDEDAPRAARASFAPGVSRE